MDDPVVVAGKTSVAALLSCLKQLERLHERLGMLLERHLQAVRKADLNTMRAAQDEARHVAQTLQRQNAARQRMMLELAQSLGLKARKNRGATLAELADRLGPEDARTLREARDRLRRVGSTTASLQRVSALSTRDLLGHVNAVLAAVRPAVTGGITYGRTGAVATGAAPQLVDALG